MAALERPPGTSRPRLNRRRVPRRKPKLRIALFADAPKQPRWMVEAFARIAASDFAEIVLVAVSRRDKPALPWLWRIWRRVDRLFFGSRGTPDARVDLRTAIPASRHVTSRRHPDGLAAAWRKAGAADQQLDVAFLLGDLDEGEFENIARYGVWRYCFGATHGIREELAGWREVADGAPVTVSGLRVRLWPDSNRLLYQSSSRTYPFSVLKNRVNLFRKTALFAERELRMLHLLGGVRLKKHGTPLAGPAPNPHDKPPGAVESARGLARVLGRIVRRGVQKLLNVDQWFIAYRFGASGWDGGLSGYTRLVPPLDRIWADPFPLYREGRYYIFFEEVLFASGKGHIAVIEVDANGQHGAPVKVLERDYHLSYPFLIEHDGALFMVPESGQNRSVELYRCVRFPDVWQLEKVLLSDLPCADATFHRGDDRWWMFVNSGAEGTELYDELHLFHADDLLGDWQSHRDNPVKSDVCCSRPAGALYVRDGILHRPAQICAPLYGSGVAISQVLQLTPLAYQEKEVERVMPPPDQGILGLHTLNRSGELSVVDGFTRRNRL